MVSVKLTVGKITSNELAFTNRVYLNPVDYAKFTKGKKLDSIYIKIKEFVFTAEPQNDVKQGTIGFNSIQRQMGLFAFEDPPIDVKLFLVEKHRDIYLSSLEVEVNTLKKTNEAKTLNCKVLDEIVKRVMELQIFTINQQFVIEVERIVYLIRISNYEVVDLRSLKEGDVSVAKNAPRGLLTKKTTIEFTKGADPTLRLEGMSSTKSNMIIKPNWDFAQMGIGGLDHEFGDIFRRAFASRIFPTSILKEIGINHVRGILLYGPPGTGKTLLARQIGKMLNSREPKIVRGPEILDKYVGEAEAKIRALFVDAEKEYQQRGDDSDLHIIIFDEIDAICKTRGSVNSGTGVHDTIVNQLLTKIDGVESLNNILLIGMTNRKDMIDEALLRPGRLEVQIEIGLPDEKGRLQIYNIHTKKMKESGHLAPDVDLGELAALSKNYTGAEIEGVVKAASSYSFNHFFNSFDDLKKSIVASDVIISRQNFLDGIREVPPKFGVATNEFENACPNGIVHHGRSFTKLMETCHHFVSLVKNSARTPVVSILLEGITGTGKTALAATIARESGFPYVKLVSPEQYVGFSETAKAQHINKVFEDAYRSSLSCIVVDDIERLLEYVRIGPRFSNVVLQTLFVLLKKTPPAGRNILIIGTTSSRQVLTDMSLLDVFNAILHVPCVTPAEGVSTVLQSVNMFNEGELEKISSRVVQPIAVKKLLMITEMAQQGDANIPLVDRFLQCMEDYGVDY